MIINTRPIEIGKKTNILLQELKCDFIHLPFTQITKLEPPLEIKNFLSNVSTYDAVIFTSQSAVRHGINFFQKKFSSKETIPVISIGLATQNLLKEFHVMSVVPLKFNSLGLSELIKEKSYKRCLVFCGEKIPSIISMTNAHIDVFPCYESLNKENIDFKKIKNLDKLIFLIYTQQSLEVLTMQFEKKEMQEVKLIVASNRIKKLALSYNFKDCILAKSPHDKDMIKAAIAKY